MTISTEDLVELLSRSNVDTATIDRAMDILLTDNPGAQEAVFALASSYASADPMCWEKQEDMPRLCFRAALELDAETVIAAMLSVPFELNGNPVLLTSREGKYRIEPFNRP